MNTITKRVLVTHELRWFWKNVSLRRHIREISETGKLDGFTDLTPLPAIDRDQLQRLITADPRSIVSQVLVEYSLDELLLLHRVVFMGDSTVSLNLEVSPLTDKVGKYVLPYTGVMVVFCLADLLLRSDYGGTLSLDTMDCLTHWRWLAATRLHLFTKRLTRISADNNPTYGVQVINGEARVYLTNNAYPGADEITVATQTYPGNIPTVWRQVRVSPVDIEFSATETSLDTQGDDMAFGQHLDALGRAAKSASPKPHLAGKN